MHLCDVASHGLRLFIASHSLRCPTLHPLSLAYHSLAYHSLALAYHSPSPPFPCPCLPTSPLPPPPLQRLLLELTREAMQGVGQGHASGYCHT